MRLADYVMNILEKIKVEHIFMLSGGGMMYLVDALGRSSIEAVCCHHEQAAGIAAQAYAIEKNDLGVCMITTGPGGTNAVTATGAAYMDSTPMLFISGQVKRADFASIRNVRQYGAQENDIVSMVKPVTKYAVTVTSADKIKYHLEKAVYMAMEGRQGPVWLDIPLDIQNAEINPEELEGFNPEEESRDRGKLDNTIRDLIQALKVSKRPLLLMGHGVKASKSEDIIKSIVDKIQLPVVATWRALDIFDYDNPLFFGSPGLQANRYSNIITQAADLLIVVGSRMDNMITAFNEEHFAFRAKKYIIDIDENEINKLAMKNVNSLVWGAGEFLNEFMKKISDTEFPAYKEWIDYCSSMKKRFPLLEEKQANESDLVDLYKLTMELSEHCNENDVLVVSSTSRCNTAGHMAFKHKAGQRVVSSMGFGSMGFALPSVVGAWFASGKNRVIALEGDGSLQLNIQELQTLVHHNMDAKLFIFRNDGYAAIATMQDRNFEGFHVGCDAESGVSMPNLKKIAEAYGIEYCCIRTNDEIKEQVAKTLKNKGPAICEFVGSILFDEIPKCISSLDENGNRVSAALENPFPFLTEEELQEIFEGI